MILPCEIKSYNGYNVSFIPSINDDRISGTFKISNLGFDSKEFIFANDNLLSSFYYALLSIYKNIGTDTIEVRTINFAPIRLDSYIAVITNDKNLAIINLKSRHITTEKEFKPVCMIEIDKENLFILLTTIGKVIFEDDE